MSSITSWMRLEPRSRNAEMKTSLQARIYDPLWLLSRQWQLGEFQGEDNGSPILARWRAEHAPLNRFHLGILPQNSRLNAATFDGRQMPLETLVERETVRPVRFKITEQSLANLKIEGIPDDVVDKLRAIKNRGVDDEEQFLALLKTTIGDEQTLGFKSLIMKQAEVKLEKLRLAAHAGQHFLRILAQQPMSRDYRKAFIRQYPFPVLTSEERNGLDSKSISFCDLMALRIPDGRQLHEAFRPNDAGEIRIDPALQIAPADLAEVQKAARRWLEWFDTLFTEPVADNHAWSSERMEYSFSVATHLSDGERTLTAQEYFEGHLDWYNFDSNPMVTLGPRLNNSMKEITQTVIPAPVSFKGMPAPRFWEFEDAQVNFGSVDAGPTDLARMLLVEFAVAYGNDWFVIPMELDIGAIYKTRSLVITDTFGVRTLIKPAASESTWRMYEHSYLRESRILRPESGLFFLAPALLQSLESRPIEEVLFLRDEMANLAWGVERAVESPTEQSLNRFEFYLEQKRQHEQVAPRAPTTSEVLRYRLTTEVPDYWIPLLPVCTEKGLCLQRGAVLKTDGEKSIVEARGRILETGQELSLFEEEVPREGVRVTRSYQFTRWIDGSSYLWVGRRKGVGRGEGSSGLMFDSLT